MLLEIMLQTWYFNTCTVFVFVFVRDCTCIWMFVSSSRVGERPDYRWFPQIDLIGLEGPTMRDQLFKNILNA